MYYRWLLSLFLFSMLWSPVPSVAATSLSGAEPLFVGAYLNGVEQEPIYILQQDESYWVSIDDITKMLSIEIQAEHPPYSINTPIGRQALPAELIYQLDSTLYLSHQTLNDLIKVELKFLSSLYAISLDIPWTIGAKLVATSSPSPQPSNTIKPPKGSLSFIRFETFAAHQLGNQDDNISSTLDTGGRFASGAWGVQLTHEDVADSSPFKLNRYYWDKYSSKHALRIGRNYIGLSPLLHSYDFTGVQWAYSNKNITRYTDFERSFSQDSFLADDQRQQRTIAGQDGPPAGIAELRINHKSVARVRIGLNGRYEFSHIPESVGGFNVTEIYLYERHLQQEPIAIIDYTRTLVSGILKKGEILARSGFGETGNTLYPDKLQPSDMANFLHARYGLSDKWTFETTLQRSVNADTELLLTNKFTISSHWAGALSFANRNSHFGAQTEIIGVGEDWDLNFRGFHRSHAYLEESTNRYDDYNLRTFYRLNKSLSLGLVGRYLKNEPQKEVQFILPAANWRPNNNFFASATPNFDENYRLHANYHFTPHLQLTSEFEDEKYTQQLDYHINDDMRLSIAHTQVQRENKYSSYALLDWRPNGNQYSLFHAGISLNNGESSGFLFSWQRIFAPGIEMHLEYHNQYRLFEKNKDNHFLTANIVVDFARVGNRFIPADNRNINSTRGGIVGAIKQPSGGTIPVDNISFRINGRRLSQQQAGGYFHVNQLKSGTYKISIDESQLPIEYSAKHRHYNVEVAASAFTEVNFEVVARYGIAGKVTSNNDQAITGASVVLTSKDGLSTYESTTNTFGFYRIDQIPPGDYTLTASQSLGKTTPVRQVLITNDYLFGQDLSF